MRTRLRPAHPVGVLAELLRPYDHTRWPDHVARVAETVEFARRLDPPPSSVADLACGDGAVPEGIAGWAAGQLGRPVPLFLGDLVGDWPLCGPIEETVEQLPSGLDLFVCSETVEHLDDPDTVLAKAAARASRLLLTTPLGETCTDNPEHYWGWDELGVLNLLVGAGWEPVEMLSWSHPPTPYYTFQFWLARSAVK